MVYALDKVTYELSRQINSKIEDLILESLPIKVDTNKPYWANVIASDLTSVVDKDKITTYFYKNTPFLKIYPMEFNQKFNDNIMSHSFVAEFKYIKL